MGRWGQGGESKRSTTERIPSVSVHWTEKVKLRRVQWSLLKNSMTPPLSLCFQVPHSLFPSALSVASPRSPLFPPFSPPPLSSSFPLLLLSSPCPAPLIHSQAACNGRHCSGDSTVLFLCNRSMVSVSMGVGGPMYPPWSEGLV